MLEKEAAFFKILASPHRLQLLNFISYAPRTVEDCAKRIGQSIQNTSLHLKALAKADILSSDKVKNFNFYSVQKGKAAHDIFSQLDMEYFSLLPKEIRWENDLTELIKAVCQGKIHLVDLRESEERLYIPVSKALVFDQAVEGVIPFLKDHFNFKSSIVFFCRGRVCARLLETVELSIKAGFNVKALPLSARGLEAFGQEIQRRL